MGKTPGTRQSADHSMAFIVSRMLLKALQRGSIPATNQETWKLLMLTPYDYGKEALFDPQTRALMQKITFEHGGPEYDSKYPDGIPTSIDIFQKGGKKFSSGMVMYPSGHARNTTANLRDLLTTKNKMLGDLVFKGQASFDKFIGPLVKLKELSAAQLQALYDFDFSAMKAQPPIDGERAPASKL